MRETPERANTLNVSEETDKQQMVKFKERMTTVLLFALTVSCTSSSWSLTLVRMFVVNMSLHRIEPIEWAENRLIRMIVNPQKSEEVDIQSR